MKKIFFCCCLFVGLPFLAKAQKDVYTLKLKINYNYNSTNFDYEYILKNKWLKRTKIAPYKPGVAKPDIFKDSVLLNYTQFAEVRYYTNEHCSEENDQGVCRALSPIYAHIELQKSGNPPFYLDYAPCRSDLLVEPFVGLQNLLERFFE